MSTTQIHLNIDLKKLLSVILQWLLSKLRHLYNTHQTSKATIETSRE